MLWPRWRIAAVTWTCMIRHARRKSLSSATFTIYEFMFYSAGAFLILFLFLCSFGGILLLTPLCLLKLLISDPYTVHICKLHVQRVNLPWIFSYFLQVGGVGNLPTWLIYIQYK